MTTSLTELLARVGAPVAFAAEGRISAGDLAIEVAGVGRLRLPITPVTVRKLSGVARPAPFGLGEETLFDPAVRRSWEIPSGEVRIRGRGWDAALADYLRKAQVELGLPAGATLEAVFDKLLVYEKGQFFKPHQDSERDDDMVASLVVLLPSEHHGGDLVVEHHGETRTFTRAKSCGHEVSLVVFYADCRHEVRPVTSGARVTLTYQLRLRGDRAAASAPAPDLATALEESVRDHFARPVKEPYSQRVRSPAARLVVLLDHEYTQRSLAWDRLKGADRARVAALTAVAERLDCERFLALAEVHETWSCMRDRPNYGGRRRRDGRDSWRDADDEEDDASDREIDATGRARDYELLDLEEFEIHLDHWVDAAGKRSPGLEVPIDDCELVEPRPSLDLELEPYRVEHEGYQGNYGNTVDRWYHRAALVMWPRTNSFVLRARHAPGWAVDQLLAIPPGDIAGLESKVAALLPSWRSSVGWSVSSRFAARAMKVATRIQQPSMARAWLRPVGWRRLDGAGARRDLLQLVDRHGLEWAQGLVTEWRGGSFYGIREDGVDMLPMCEFLAGSGSVTGRALAVWWVERELDAAVRAYVSGHAPSSLWLELDDAPCAPRPSRARSARRSRSARPPWSMPRCNGCWMRRGPRPYPSSWRCSRVHRGPEPLRTYILGSPLREVCVARLAAIASRPPRAPDDWSIDVPLACKCEECKALGRFLRSQLTALDLPLAKERREHLHVLIDNARLPVLHATRREGRPYTLQLRKDRDLFRREAEHRERAEGILRELAMPAAVATRGGSRPTKPKRPSVKKASS
ncbi:MAG: 2OG-Fe(II) oxygenase [Deltaproteobacteria bacterium]|nr:2OG-Fe(II) oxygenase [Deltaproteobacteria bacterium]